MESSLLAVGRKVRFDDALQNAQNFIQARKDELGTDVVLVRDLLGRIRIAVAIERNDRHLELSRELHLSLGAFSPGEESIFLYRGEMFDPNGVFSSSDALLLGQNPLQQQVRILDRQLMGQDWLRKPLSRDAHPPRATLFGIKGGVGRSTALAVWAWRLVQAGKKVLVIDLDLESPGVTTTLLPEDSRPRFGIVDWMVEDLVGQSDSELLDDLVATSPLGRDSDGVIRIVPAGGYSGTDYMSKLARTYMGAPLPKGEEGFAERVERMLLQLEQQEQPDIVLIDSRAGLHDIAAVALTRLDALSFLFAINTSQSWEGYDLLFRHWREHSEVTRLFRDNLQMVAALVPETHITEYLETYRESAYQLFADNLYDEVIEPEASGLFNFDLNDPDAPHSPLRINWGREFQEFDPVRNPEALSESQLASGYGDFVDRATQLVLGETLG